MIDENDSHRRARAVAGTLASGLWLALWTFAIWGDYSAATLVNRETALTLNEWSALALQTEQSVALIQEHARHAAATATLAELELAAHRRHEDARRAVLAPDFRFANATFSAGHRVATFAMVNAGGTAYGLRFQSDDFADGRIRPSEVVERNAGFSLHVSLDPVLRDKGGTFTIECRDIEGRGHALLYRIEDGAVVPADAPPQPRQAEPVAR